MAFFLHSKIFVFKFIRLIGRTAQDNHAGITVVGVIGPCLDSPAFIDNVLGHASTAAVAQNHSHGVKGVKIFHSHKRGVETDSDKGRSSPLQKTDTLTRALLEWFFCHLFWRAFSRWISREIDLSQPPGFFDCYVTHQHTNSVRWVVVFCVKSHGIRGVILFHIGFPANGWISVRMGNVGSGI